MTTELAYPPKVPRRLIENPSQFYNIVNAFNGTYNLYNSLFPLTELPQDAQSWDYHARYADRKFEITPDKALFEFDLKYSGCIARYDAQRLHEDLLNVGIAHRIVFSGNGYYVVPYIQDEPLKNKKSALKSFQQAISHRLQLHANLNDRSPDPIVFGNLAQVVGIVNTLNIKDHLGFGFKRFRIVISAKELALPIPKLAEIAKKPRKFDVFYGSRLLSLKPYDNGNTAIPTAYNGTLADIEDLPTIPAIEDEIKSFYPCVKKLILQHVSNRQARFCLILYFRDIGLLPAKALAILKYALTPEKYAHMLNLDNGNESGHELGQFGYLWYIQQDFCFPCQSKMREYGFCVEGCRMCEEEGLYG